MEGERANRIQPPDRGVPSLDDKRVVSPEEFHRRIGTFSEAGQEVIADLSSSLLEPDIAEQIRSNTPEKIPNMPKRRH